MVCTSDGTLAAILRAAGTESRWEVGNKSRIFLQASFAAVKAKLAGRLLGL